MGSPKRQRKKFSKPSHPWQKERISEERELIKEYGLKNKKELWKANSLLRGFAQQVKNLIAAKTSQAEIEKSQLMNKVLSLGLIDKNAKLDDVLGITLKNILDRRLQTLVYKKNLTRSIKQARQFIVHEHINIGDKKITVPSYLVRVDEEPLINFTPTSPLFNLEHPEKPSSEETTKKVKKKKVKKEKKNDSTKE